MDVSLSKWLLIYRWIVNKLGYSYFRDFISALILSILTLFKAIHLRHIKSNIYGRIVCIFGASESLIKDLNKVKNIINRFRKYIIIISADAASAHLYKEGIYPDIIVTDLDGDITKIILLHKLYNSVIALHAHGDNIPEIIWYIRYFKKVLATTQSIPLPNVYNVYGFTDGDRAIYLAYLSCAKRIYLFGMDFLGPIGRFTKLKTQPSNVKRIKLIIGYILYKMLPQDKIVNLSKSI